jgi:hypothetical protein
MVHHGIGLANRMRLTIKPLFNDQRLMEKKMGKLLIIGCKKAMDEKITKIHVGPCIADHCPHKDVILNKIKAKSGVEVIEGTHPYKPDHIFA